MLDARLRLSLGHRAGAFVTRPGQLLLTVGHEPIDLILIELRPAAGATMRAAIHKLRELAPWVPIVALCRDGDRWHREVVPLIKAGVTALLFPDESGFETELLDALEAAASRSSLTELVQRIGRVVAPGARGFVTLCLERGALRSSVESLAVELAIHPNTLRKRLAASGLASPSQLVAWGRLFAATSVLERTGCSVEAAALRLAFGSGAALRRMFVRHLGIGPREVLKRGGTAFLERKFSDTLRVASPAV
jgi:AraC-like DNA-binding protein